MNWAHTNDWPVVREMAAALGRDLRAVGADRFAEAFESIANSQGPSIAGQLVQAAQRAFPHVRVGWRTMAARLASAGCAIDARYRAQNLAAVGNWNGARLALLTARREFAAAIGDPRMAGERWRAAA